MAGKKKIGASRQEAADYFGVGAQTIDDWNAKKWIVRFEDRSIDLESTTARVDTLRNPFVGGKPDRGVEPKRAGERARAGAEAVEITTTLRGGLRGVGKAAGISRKIKNVRRRGNEFLPTDLTVPTECDFDRKQPVIMAAKTEGAPAVFGGLRPGGSVAGVNKGQFSAWELLAAALAVTGPADVDVCTWTTSGEAVTDLRRMLDGGQILSLRMILDVSLASREPEYCQHLLQKIGNDRVRTTRNHAKWCVIRNESWNVVIRGSMNFGSAPRLEFFEASDDAALAAFLTAIGDELFERAPVWNFQADGQGLQFESAALADAVSEIATQSAASDRLTVDQIADALHLTHNAVTRMRNTGRLTFDDDGCTTLDRAKNEIRNAGRTAPVAVVSPDDPGGDFVDFVEARRRREVADAEVAEMKAAQMRRDLILTADAERMYCDCIQKAKVKFEAIPNRCAEMLTGFDADGIRRVLQQEIESVLAELFAMGDGDDK